MSEPDGIIMTERMDWDNMRVFRIVAELGSMNAAAHRLQESAPTIGRKIDQLEKDLNTTLLVRTTRGVELTDAGRIALAGRRGADRAHDQRREQCGYGPWQAPHGRSPGLVKGLAPKDRAPDGMRQTPVRVGPVAPQLAGGFSAHRPVS